MDSLLVGIDVGSRCHRVAIGTPDGVLVDQFDVEHQPDSLANFFSRVEKHAHKLHLSVSVGMEGYGGWARPLDTMVIDKGWKLLNVNNLKLARFKEIFPSPAKTDAIDARKIVELMRLQPMLPQAKDVLNKVVEISKVNHDLKLLTRRRSRLVDEKIRIIGRMHPDLQSITPGLVEITGSVDNMWFLSFLTSRDNFNALIRMHKSSLMKIKGIGSKYAEAIRNWQKHSCLSKDSDIIGEMVIDDANRMLALIEKIKKIELRIESLISQSQLAKTIQSIPGFGIICSAELAGEIGTMKRFSKEDSLARYIGMAPLDNSSGRYTGAKGGKQVNRHAKTAMMTAAARHYACVSQSKAYYDKKRGEGKKHNQAVRSLGRHLSRAIWSLVKHRREYTIQCENE